MAKTFLATNPPIKPPVSVIQVTKITYKQVKKPANSEVESLTKANSGILGKERIYKKDCNPKVIKIVIVNK